MWYRVFVFVSVIIQVITTSSWTEWDITTLHNPLTNATACGNTMASHVCDPNDILTEEEGEVYWSNILNHSIRFELGFS